MKSLKPIAIILGVLVVLFFAWLILSESTRDRPFNWNESYNQKDDQPYGLEVFFDMAEDLFPDKDVKPISANVFREYDEEIKKWPNYMDESHQREAAIRMNEEKYKEEQDNIDYYDSDYYDSEESIYEDLKSKYSLHNMDSLVNYEIPVLKEFEKHSYLAVAKRFGLREYDAKSLLTHVYQGNNALLVANEFDGLIPEYFDITTETARTYELFNEERKKSWTLHFTSDSAKNAYYLKQKTQKDIKDNAQKKYFRRDEIPVSTFDLSLYKEGEIEVLASNEMGKPVLIKCKHGKGNFYFCSVPLAFSNYFILNDTTREFAERTISLLPVEDTYLANYYLGSSKSSRSAPPKDQSLLQIIKKYPPLKWALYTLAGTILLFMLTELRRKRRPVPVIEPLRNTSIQFVETISQLYLKTGNHRNIAEKKYHYFLEYLRSTYGINTYELDQTFFVKLSEKTAFEASKLQTFFSKIEQDLDSDVYDANKLLRLHHQIKNFKRGKL